MTQTASILRCRLHPALTAEQELAFLVAESWSGECIAPPLIDHMLQREGLSVSHARAWKNQRQEESAHAALYSGWLSQNSWGQVPTSGFHSEFHSWTLGLETLTEQAYALHVILEALSLASLQYRFYAARCPALAAIDKLIWQDETSHVQLGLQLIPSLQQRDGILPLVRFRRLDQKAHQIFRTAHDTEHLRVVFAAWTPAPILATDPANDLPSGHQHFARLYTHQLVQQRQQFLRRYCERTASIAVPEAR